MIHLIVGNTGSGKTTYAKHLREETKGVIFSIDTWNNTLFMPDKTPDDGLDWFLERIDRAETLILDLVRQLEASGTDSILDLGLARLEHREKFRAFARQEGYGLKIHFLDIPKAVRLRRVMQRNSEKGDTYAFEVTRENFDFMETWFQPPAPEEMYGGVTIRD